MIALGVDGGASKTHAVLADDQGRVLGVGRAGCGNWEVVGLEGARATLHEAVGGALAQAGLRAAQVMASGYGLAGCDWPSDEGRLLPLIASLGLSGPVNLVNDAFLPLRAGTRDGVGIAAIAGSGTGVAGRNRAGQIARSFGAGYPFSDWGGAGEIVREAFLGGATVQTTGPGHCADARSCGGARLRLGRSVAGGRHALGDQALRPAGAAGVRGGARRRCGGQRDHCQSRSHYGRERGGGGPAARDARGARSIWSPRAGCSPSAARCSTTTCCRRCALKPLARGWPHGMPAPVVGAVLLGLDLLHPERPLAPEAIAAQVSAALAALDA